MRRLLTLALTGLLSALLLLAWVSVADARLSAVTGGYSTTQEQRVRTVDALLLTSAASALPPMVAQFEDLGPGAAGISYQDLPSIVYIDPVTTFDVGEVYAHEIGHQWAYRLGSYARAQWQSRVGGHVGGGWQSDPDEALGNAVSQYLFGTWVPWRSGLNRPSDYRTWLAERWASATWPDVAGEDAELVSAGIYVRQRGLMYGLDTGQFGSWSYLTRRQVMLVMIRVRVWKWIAVPWSWDGDYSPATRDDLAAVWPGLDWKGGTTETYLTRSAFARLLYRGRV